MQDLGSEALFFTQQSEQQMLRADVFVVETLRFLGAIREDAFAFMAERQIDRSGHFLTNCRVSLDLLPYGIDRGMRPQKTIRQLLVFPQKSEQQVLRFDIGTAELTRLVAGEEDYTSRFLRITFEHCFMGTPFAAQPIYLRYSSPYHGCKVP